MLAAALPGAIASHRSVDPPWVQAA